MTNYEKIKSMTIEEMAKFIENFDTEDYCRYCEDIFDFCRGNKCNESAMEWLNAEVIE